MEGQRERVRDYIGQNAFSLYFKDLNCVPKREEESSGWMG